MELVCLVAFFASGAGLWVLVGYVQTGYLNNDLISLM
jgi:hypothetical protein